MIIISFAQSIGLWPEQPAAGINLTLPFISFYFNKKPVASIRKDHPKNKAARRQPFRSRNIFHPDA
jgi:hypothetical protein